MGGLRPGQILCPIVVGRDAELTAVEHGLADARAGRAALLCLVGEAGIGKSRIAREARLAAEACGMLVLKGRNTSTMAPAPYRALAEALTPVLDHSEIREDRELESLRPVLRSVLSEQRNASAPELSAPFIRYAVIRLLGSLARQANGLLLVLEDIHWADPDTLAVLGYLSDNISGERVLCIATLRDDPGPALDLVETMAARRTVSRLTLRRLSTEEIAEMARCSLDAQDLPAAMLNALAERAEGVPFVVEEMLTAYVESDREEFAPFVLPHTYRELVSMRLEATNDAARRVLFSAAIVGRQFNWSLLSAISGLDRQDVLDGLHIAMRQKLVTSDPAPGLEMPFGFRHALVREAILAELLPPEISDLAERAANVIEVRYVGLPGEWCERVAELRAIAGDSSAAARHLQERTTRLGARCLASAEEMLERARILVADDRWHRIGIDRQLVEVLSLSGKVDRLREIAASALGFVHEKRASLPFLTLGLGYLHLRLARGLSTAGDHAGAEEHLSRARDFALETGEKRLGVRVRVFAALLALECGDLQVALSAARDASEEARQVDAPDALAEALSVEGNAAFLNGDAEAALQTLRCARDAGDDAILPRIRGLLDLGRIEACTTGDVSSLEAARSLAVQAGAVSAEASADLLMAETAILRFDLEQAGDLLARSINIARRYGLALQDDAMALDAARRALEPGDAEAEPAVASFGSPSLAHVMLALRLEDRAGAWRAAEQLPGNLVAHAVASLLPCLTTKRLPDMNRLIRWRAVSSKLLRPLPSQVSSRSSATRWRTRPCGDSRGGGT